MRTIDSLERRQLNSLNRSLSAIRDAHGRLDHLSDASATPAALMSRIQLCDRLLQEISGIRRRLARGLGARASTPTPARGAIQRPH